MPLHRFMKRVLTEPERLYFWDRFAHSTPKEDVLNRANTISEFLAGRYVHCTCSQPTTYKTEGSLQKKPAAKHAITWDLTRGASSPS
jgi:hypothetical protein